ncbi:hypothetical protein [Virgibacillus ihumii]|uniref:hypothetical protein n=1 Tax=Virgibacillus ihumii TaxID=2686091 RepID=UPI00157C1950|nr:hypothetical protein [Virgibacillus ihumii]
MAQDQAVKERRGHPENKNPRMTRKARLKQSYLEASKRNFDVKKEDFDNDLILSKLKKYMR